MGTKMPLRKRLLFAILAVSLFAHGSALYFFHEMPLYHSWGNPRNPFSPIVKQIHKVEKEELLTEVFSSFLDTALEKEKDFYELNPEYVSIPTFLSIDNVSCFSNHSVSLPFDLPNDPVATFVLPETALENFPFSLDENLFPSPPYADLPLDNHETKVASSEDFILSVEYAPRSFKPGFVFHLILEPKKEVAFKRIRQNFFFLIDRSNSIPRLRYQLNKHVVLNSLRHLKEGDHFTILLFDDHVLRLSETLLPWNEENKEKARQFLEAHGHGGVFASTELYSSLGKILPQKVADQEVNTAILLSDGDTYLTLEKQRKMIGEWTAKNGGKVSLFSVTSGTGNNLPLLELISIFNKGELVHTLQHDLLQEKMDQLILSLAAPIGKNLVATPVCPDRQITITLQPKNVRLPHLYQQRKLEIWGTINRLSDFTLFVQGSYYDKVFDIRKEVCFKEALLGTVQLEKKWASIAAQEFYERFFQEGKLSDLEDAKQFLAPLSLSIPLDTKF